MKGLTKNMTCIQTLNTEQLYNKNVCGRVHVHAHACVYVPMRFCCWLENI